MTALVERENGHSYHYEIGLVTTDIQPAMVTREWCQTLDLEECGIYEDMNVINTLYSV